MSFYSYMKIGVTERGDPSLDKTWYEKLMQCDGGIIITKNLNVTLQDKILSHSRPITIHATCTGWGGSKMEPNVPEPEDQLDNVEFILERGFPEERMVIRIDPIIPTEEGLKRARRVLELLERSGLSNLRVRVSVYDEYKHAAARLPEPIYGGAFSPPKEMLQEVVKLLKSFDREYEICAEPYLAACGHPFKIQGCVSVVDLKRMGLEQKEHPLTDAEFTINPQQRSGCKCLGVKQELLSTRGRCEHKCLYCYWKD